MKKILIIGASNHEVDVVKMAKKLGYYAIVTDYYDSWEDNPAKYEADEIWHISWSDTEALAEKCREQNVSGVLGGFSEFRVESMINLCEALNLPCYINHDQLAVTRDKGLFKQLCKKFDVPIVNEYSPDDPNIVFPVIIKPTDRGGSIGINVAYNAEEYKKHLEYAYSMSPSKSVVVEDFIGDGVKFDCSYVMTDDKVTLIETCDTTMLSKDKGCETFQKAWTFPSCHESEYIEQVDSKVKSMLASLNMKCGVANISFFYRNGKFYVFETGFRLGGGHSFDYQRATGGIDYLEMLIKYALNEPFKLSDISTDRGVAVTYNVYVKGNVGDIVQGFISEDEVLNISGLVTYLKYAYKGMVIHQEKPFNSVMITICAKDVEELYKKVAIINNHLKLSTDKNVYEIFSTLEKGELVESLCK